MNYLLSSKNPFGSRGTHHQEVDDDTLRKIKMQTQNAREQLQEAMVADDDSVNMILQESGISKLKHHNFDYDQLDERIRQREIMAKKRREDMNRRLRLKEIQLFPQTQKEKNTDKAHHVVLEDSIDATMRKHDPKNSVQDLKYKLNPSPLPTSPLENIKRWKEKLEETKYELPSQEEKRLQQEWERTNKQSTTNRHESARGVKTPTKLGRPRRDSTEEFLTQVDKLQTSIDEDKFFSFTESSPLKDKYSQFDKFSQLQEKNDRLEDENFQLVKERDYWKRKAKLAALENEKLQEKNDHLRSKVTRLLDENKKLFDYSASKQHDDGDSMMILETKKPNQNQRVEFDADDTTQLIKYASRSLEA